MDPSNGSMAMVLWKPSLLPTSLPLPACVARQRCGIYPPVLPPPDFFNEEEERVAARLVIFIKHNIYNYLYNETLDANLSVAPDGAMILDRTSKDMISDAVAERETLDEYCLWIDSALGDAKEGMATQTMGWLETLKENVLMDWADVDEECDALADRERRVRRRSDRKTPVIWGSETGPRSESLKEGQPKLYGPYRIDGIISNTELQDPRWRYHSVPARYWHGIYPPLLPPTDFFDLEEEEKWVREQMFKKDNKNTNVLYDETGKVDLPVDAKGILILDPVSRTRILDARMEWMILAEYGAWIYDALEDTEIPRGGDTQTVDWLIGLRKAVAEDYSTVTEEKDLIIDEERRKRGLTDWRSHLDWCATGRRFVRLNEDEKQDDQGSGKSAPDSDGESIQSSKSQYDAANQASDQSASVSGDDPRRATENQEYLDEDIGAVAAEVSWTELQTGPFEPSTECLQATEDGTAPPLDLFMLWS